MKRIKIKLASSEKKTRQTWSFNPVTRVHENDPKKNKKKERQKNKLLLKKAQDDAPFEFFGIDGSKVNSPCDLKLPVVA